MVDVKTIRATEMPNSTIEIDGVSNRVARSALIVCIYVLFAPAFVIFSYDLLFNFSWIAHAKELYGSLSIIPIGRLFVFYPAGFIHALLAGGLVALLSTGARSKTTYLAVATLIGAAIALFFPLPGPQVFHMEFWKGIGLKFIACFGLGSFFCAVLTLPFRATPKRMP